jgi:hypothetical protein
LSAVEQIEELCSELYVTAFGDAGPLEDSKIKVVDSVRAQRGIHSRLITKTHSGGGAKQAVLNQLASARLPPFEQPAKILGRTLPTPKLAHCRLVLLHLPQREQVLARLIAALKPGGWLVDEEFDSASLEADPQVNPVEVVSKTHRATLRVVEDRGVERRFGRLLPRFLRSHGLIDVGAEGHVFMWQAGSPGTSLMRANHEQLREEMITAGYITEEEFKEDLSRIERADFLTLSPIMWTACGRRPLS